MKILTIQFSVASFPSPHMNTLRSNTNVHVLGQCETPSFTPIQHNRQNYNTLYSLTFWCMGLVHSEYVQATSCWAGQEILHPPSSYRPVTGPYTAPDESNPTSLEYTLILSSHIRRGPTQARYFNLEHFVYVSSPIHAVYTYNHTAPMTVCNVSLKMPDWWVET